MKRLLDYLKNYFLFTRWIYIGIFVALLLDILLVIILPQTLSLDNADKSSLLIAGIIIFILALMIFPGIFIIIFISQSFRGDSNFKKIIIILHSYLGIIILFASIYFAFCFVGDFNDQVHKNSYYESEIRLQELNSEYQILRISDNRPFKGVKYKLWTGVENPDNDILIAISSKEKAHYNYILYGDNFIRGEIEEVPIEICLKAAALNLPPNKLYKFQNANLKNVIFDCIYFSITTIATVGYGDISPNLWYSKLAAIIEILCGIIIFVFALNFAFTNWKNLNSRL